MATRTMSKVTAAIGAQNTFSAAVAIGAGKFGWVISGTFVATVTLQMSFDEITWYDIETQTAVQVRVGDNPTAGLFYRAGVATGDYTSGTATMVIFQ